MKVLLCRDVKKLGWVGDVDEVNAGYARNLLLPQGLAMLVTEANLRSIAKERVHRAEERIKERKGLEEVAGRVEGAEAVVAAKANVQGRLFGSVSASQISANLREQGFEVPDSVVELPEHIKEVGTHTVTLRFADDLSTTISVVVVAEGVDVTTDAISEPAEETEEGTTQ
jgi:large subunit ribosomal protein L9